MAKRIELRRTTQPLVRTKKAVASSAARSDRCRRKFLRHFPGGFYGPKYLSWERGYKEEAHEQWLDELSRSRFERKLDNGEYLELARAISRIEGRTNLLFSFEKMALRDAVSTEIGARNFTRGLFEYLHGGGSMESRFTSFAQMLGGLPRKETRVLSWPLLTVFGFIAQPKRHIFLKPNVTRRAVKKYGYDFTYSPKPTWATYSNMLDFAKTIARDIEDLEPRDMIDIQSFIWVLGSDEYP
jgi:hypothetical protein